MQYVLCGEKRIADVALLHSLYLCRERKGTFGDVDDVTITYLRNHLNRNCFVVGCVAEEADNTLVGIGVMSTGVELPDTESANGVFAEIYELYVLPEFRGQGIGSQIMVHLQNVASHKGIFKITIRDPEKI